MKYVALLRGINVGGNHKVSMSELKGVFEKLGFQNVSTYINSGNVLFETARESDATLVQECQAAFESQFGFSVPLAVISAQDFTSAMKNAPAWWNKQPDDKNNAIFVIAPATARQEMEQVGPLKADYEKVAAAGPIIFWTTSFKNLNRTRYKSIVGGTTYQQVTIRNANTTQKLLNLLVD